jgi:hypothetical protein
MRNRSASYFLKVLSVLVAPLALVGLTASSGSAATAKAPTFFGARLTSQSQPSNAQNGQSCDESAGISPRSTCTRLVSCVKGKFRLQLAKAYPRSGKARIVANGPEITYAGQSPCGGTSGEHYVVQSFRVTLHVTKGDYIAIKAASTGALSCSGGSGFLLYAPPLRVGGRLKKSHSGASCDLLVQLSYR